MKPQSIQITIGTGNYSVEDLPNCVMQARLWGFIPSARDGIVQLTNFNALTSCEILSCLGRDEFHE